MRRPRRLANRGDRRFRVVLGAAELDLGPEQRPERAPASLVGHADAPGVDDPQPAREAPIELHVRVTADDEVGCRRSPISCATSSSGVIRVKMGSSAEGTA